MMWYGYDKIKDREKDIDRYGENMNCEDEGRWIEDIYGMNT